LGSAVRNKGTKYAGLQGVHVEAWRRPQMAGRAGLAEAELASFKPVKRCNAL